MARELLTTAVEPSQWWTDVDLWLIPKLLARLKKLKDQTPNIQRLRIRAVSSNRITSSNLVECFREAPALRGVTLVNLKDVHVLKLPWGQLTEFHLYGSTPYEFLNKMPNLTSLSLWYSDEPPSTGEIVLKSLHTLDAEMTTREVLSVLRLPALQNLKTDSSHFGLISPLIQRSSSSLKHLCFESLYESNFTDGTLASLLRHTPGLSSLDLCDAYDSLFHLSYSIIFQAIQFIGTKYLPCLRRLILPGSSLCEDNPVDKLVEMVGSRKLTSSPLKEIWFTKLQTSSEEISVANAASLNVIRAASVKVLMDTKPPGKLFVAFHDQMNLISILQLSLVVLFRIFS
ncbi:hypothetical protein C8J56DRAFT_1042778 [Mycena floridula]|nr:hypothetical protein C8J56DRAFT_1042778 [Mycena floridula]